VGEAIAAALAGGALGGVVGALVGLPVPGALVGAANGAVSGARRVYDWSRPKGVGAFVLDSTWALATTTASLACHAAIAFQSDAGFSTEMSERQNRHVYARGVRIRRGFAITVGNVVNGAGDLTKPRRRKLVTDHEDVHVWQSRWLGPLFPVLYGGWMAGGAIAGSVAWLVDRGHTPLGRLVDTYAYYLNPFEWWAYSRDAHWPPSGKLEGIGWQRPIVQSFTTRTPT
jgi:hypothetical protein